MNNRENVLMARAKQDDFGSVSLYIFENRVEMRKYQALQVGV